MSERKRRRAPMRRRSSRRSNRRAFPSPFRMPPTRQQIFQFRNLITCTSNGSGIISGMIPCDPSATLAAPFAAGAMFNEWSSVATLFSQIKCIQLECWFHANTTDEVKGDIQTGLAMATNITSISNFATSYLATADNADSQLWTSLNDNSGRPRYHALKHRRSLGWGGVATPAASAANYIGCVGGIGIYGSSYVINTQYFTIKVVGTYRLAQRS